MRLTVASSFFLFPVFFWGSLLQLLLVFSPSQRKIIEYIIPKPSDNTFYRSLSRWVCEISDLEFQRSSCTARLPMILSGLYRCGESFPPITCLLYCLWIQGKVRFYYLQAPNLCNIIHSIHFHYFRWKQRPK